MSSWWSNDRIAATVTESYISKRLGPSPKKQEALHAPLAFGAGLTDDTYLDWILDRSSRLFLILDDIGSLEHVFESVDKSFDDNDLPLNDRAISDLGLIGNVARKFAKRQYAYLVQELCDGAHVDYGEDDVLPVKELPRKQNSQLGTNVDKVQVGEKVFLRRRLSLDEESGIEKVHFVLHFKSLQKLKHPHLTSVWATYTHGDDGYILLQPFSETTLKTFLDEPPKHFKHLTKAEQRDIIIRWIQCLTNGLAYLHENGYAHQAIRPSNIYVDSQYNIFLGAYGALGALEDKDAAFEKDAYNHGAPEQWQKRATLAEINPLRSTLQSGGRTGRRIKQSRSSSHSSGSTAVPNRVSPEQTPRTGSRASNYPDSSIVSTASGTRNSTHSTPSTAPTEYTTSTSSNECRKSAAQRGRTVVTTLTYSQPNPSGTLFDASPFYPADVFSVCTIITSLLSMLASSSRSGNKLAPSNISSHLSKRNRTAGRGGAPADMSWHSNLGQVSTWLDLLDHSAEKSTSKLSLGRKDKADKEGDSETWRWKGLLTSLTDLMRLGFQKDIDVRWSAADGVSRINSTLKKWGLNNAKCCQDVKNPAVSTKPVRSKSSLSFSSRKQSIKSSRKSPSAKPNTPSIPEEIYTPYIPELPANETIPSIRGARLESPNIPELPASEADVYSPRRERFGPMSPRYISPQQQKWEFDFQPQNQQDGDSDSYYEDSVAGDMESVLDIGLDNWPSPVSPMSSYQFRELPTPPEQANTIMDRPRPQTSGMVPWPIRETSSRMGALA